MNRVVEKVINLYWLLDVEKSLLLLLIDLCSRKRGWVYSSLFLSLHFQKKHTYSSVQSVFCIVYSINSRKHLIHIAGIYLFIYINDPMPIYTFGMIIRFNGSFQRIKIFSLYALVRHVAIHTAGFTQPTVPYRSLVISSLKYCIPPSFILSVSSVPKMVLDKGKKFCLQQTFWLPTFMAAGEPRA